MSSARASSVDAHAMVGLGEVDSVIVDASSPDAASVFIGASSQSS